MFDIYSGAPVRRTSNTAEAQGHVVCCILLLITRIYCGPLHAAHACAIQRKHRAFSARRPWNLSTTSMSGAPEGRTECTRTYIEQLSGKRKSIHRSAVSKFEMRRA